MSWPSRARSCLRRIKGHRAQAQGLRARQGVRPKESGIRNQESGIRNQESGIRNQSVQFSVGRSILSTTTTSTVCWRDSSLSPGCSRRAIATDEGSVGSAAADIGFKPIRRADQLITLNGMSAKNERQHGRVGGQIPTWLLSAIGAEASGHVSFDRDDIEFRRLRLGLGPWA